MNIAVVVPTIRPERYQAFLEAWRYQFTKYRVQLVTVHDGDEPYVCTSRYTDNGPSPHYNYFTRTQVMGDDFVDIILDHTASVRNLGFAFIAKYLHAPAPDVIVTLDDDEEPYGDTIGDHLEVLGKKVPVSWMSTIADDDIRPRGMPYGIREEAEVVVSHGVWWGVLDLDAPTQLHHGTEVQAPFYMGVIPKGVLAPMSSMNLAFSRKALPSMFHAPMNMETWGFDRFDDIWGMIDAKRELDAAGYAVVTGYSAVKHLRASNVFTNLRKEAKGIELNETFWKGDESDPYFGWYRQARVKWREF